MQRRTDTTIFGDPDDFAIEAGVDPRVKPPSLVWGHMRVWCRGIALGDIERNRHCGLYVAYLGFGHLVAQLELDALCDEAFEGLDNLATWNLLDGLLYGCHDFAIVEDDRSLQQMRADSRRYGRFDFLTNWDEPFDGYKAFILCPSKSDSIRILCRKFPAGAGLRVEVSRAGVLAASQAFVQWFEEQEHRLSSHRD